MKRLIHQSHCNAINYNNAVMKSFASIVEPLLNNFPWSHFMYLRYFNDGSYLVLCNDLEPMQLYLSYNALGNNQVFLQEFSNLEDNQTDKYLWPNSNNYQNYGVSILNEHNICHGLNVTRKFQDSLESFIFAAPRECSQVTELYMNHFYIIERFIFYFKNKAQHIINPVDKQVLAFSPFYQQAINESKNTISYSHLLKDKNNFFNKTMLKKICLQDKNLCISQKAFECLYYLSFGKSAKEISSQISISPRTVESHIKNLKDKFSLNYANQLLKLGEEIHIKDLHLDKF